MKWVLVILFAEIAKRSFTNLKSQELYTIHCMAGAALADPFTGLLWKQFMATSEYGQGLGLAAELPSWAFPSKAAIETTIAEHGRTFLSVEWLPMLGLIIFGTIISKVLRNKFQPS